MNLVFSNFDPESGESYVKVNHLGKEYSAKSKLHPDDKDRASMFTGCRYAHERAEIKALKDEWKKKKAACEECRKFVKMVMQYKNFDRESPSAKAMFRQLNRRIREVNKIAEEIGSKEFYLSVAIREQDKFNKKTSNKN